MAKGSGLRITLLFALCTVFLAGGMQLHTLRASGFPIMMQNQPNEMHLK